MDVMHISSFMDVAFSSSEAGDEGGGGGGAVAA